MEVFLIQGWDPIVPGPRWLHGSQSITNHWMRVAFPHRAGWCRRGESMFQQRLVGVVHVWKGF